ncbi:unnamed protein product [Schistosoma bovis]|nr:unnamed protein product [Schistosoma bovis]
MQRFTLPQGLYFIRRMRTSLLNYDEEFLGPLGIIQEMWDAVTFKYKFRNASRAVSIEDSGSIVQSTNDAECMISEDFDRRFTP